MFLWKSGRLKTLQLHYPYKNSYFYSYLLTFSPPLSLKFTNAQTHKSTIFWNVPLHKLVIWPSTVISIHTQISEWVMKPICVLCYKGEWMMLVTVLLKSELCGNNALQSIFMHMHSYFWKNSKLHILDLDLSDINTMFSISLHYWLQSVQYSGHSDPGLERAPNCAVLYYWPAPVHHVQSTANV